MASKSVVSPTRRHQVQKPRHTDSLLDVHASTPTSVAGALSPQSGAGNSASTSTRRLIPARRVASASHIETVLHPSTPPVTHSPSTSLASAWTEDSPPGTQHATNGVGDGGGGDAAAAADTAASVSGARTLAPAVLPEGAPAAVSSVHFSKSGRNIGDSDEEDGSSSYLSGRAGHSESMSSMKKIGDVVYDAKRPRLSWLGAHPFPIPLVPPEEDTPKHNLPWDWRLHFHEPQLEKQWHRARYWEREFDEGGACVLGASSSNCVTRCTCGGRSCQVRQALEVYLAAQLVWHHRLCTPCSHRFDLLRVVRPM